jgi:hypothetical protein
MKNALTYYNTGIVVVNSEVHRIGSWSGVEVLITIFGGKIGIFS